MPPFASCFVTALIVFLSAWVRDQLPIGGSFILLFLFAGQGPHTNFGGLISPWPVLLFFHLTALGLASCRLTIPSSAVLDVTCRRHPNGLIAARLWYFMPLMASHSFAWRSLHPTSGAATRNFQPPPLSGGTRRFRTAQVCAPLPTIRTKHN